MRFVIEPHGAQCSREAGRLQGDVPSARDFCASRVDEVAFLQQWPQEVPHVAVKAGGCPRGQQVAHTLPG